MRVGELVTWIESVGVRGNAHKASARLITGIILRSESSEALTQHKVQILWISGVKPKQVNEKVWLSDSDLRRWKAEEWQHSQRRTPFELARERHKIKVEKLQQQLAYSNRPRLSKQTRSV